MTERSHRIDFDELMRLLMVTGFVALATWVAASSIGVISGYVAVSAPATLRFLLAVLVLVFARRTYWELREWRWGKLPPDERFGFSNPLVEHARASEHRVDDARREAKTAEDHVTAATGSSQPPA
jgi:hypothetical protein